MGSGFRSTSDFREISLEGAFSALGSSPGGLTEADARERIKAYGYNEVVEDKRTPVREFLLRYWGPMPWLLELAIILSMLLKHVLEGIIIFVLLTINAIISQVQSSDSRRAVELLKQKLAVKAEVLRDGKWSVRDAREVVPGDVVLSKMGQILPADAKIFEGEISVDESMLTGESLPKDLKASDIAYSGSIVKQGEARCMVVNIGANTYFGKTAELVKVAKPRSHQEEVMLTIVKYMMYLGIAASILVSVYALFLHTGSC